MARPSDFLGDTGFDLDPVDIALEMLKKELPGFESVFHSGTMAIRVSGHLPVHSRTDVETFYYPVAYPTVLGDPNKPRSREKESPLEKAERLQKEREYLQRQVAPIVKRIVIDIRNLGIDALNLMPTIDRQIEEAVETARREAYSEGIAKGKTEGRSEMLRELLEAANLQPIDLMNLEGD